MGILKKIYSKYFRKNETLETDMETDNTALISSIKSLEKEREECSRKFLERSWRAPISLNGTEEQKEYFEKYAEITKKIKEAEFQVKVPKNANLERIAYREEPQSQEEIKTEDKNYNHPEKNLEDNIEKLIEYKNSHNKYSMDRVVREANIPAIQTKEKAYEEIRKALGRKDSSYYLNRFDANIASNEMKREMAEQYMNNKQKPLKAIAENLSDKYHMHVCEETIRKYAKIELGEAYAPRHKKHKHRTKRAEIISIGYEPAENIDYLPVPAAAAV